MKQPALTAEEAREFRMKVEEMEARAAQDPRLLDTPVLAIRESDVLEENQVLVFGPDWKAEMYERRCVLCRTAVIVRPVFRGCRTIVCLSCAPRFIAEFNGERKGATA